MIEPAVPGSPGMALAAALAIWAIFRLATRSRSPMAIAGDLGLTAIVGAAIPVLAMAPSEAISVPQAVVGVSLASLGIQLRVAWSLAALVIGVGAYVWGAAALVGWNTAVLLNEVLPIIGGWLVAVVLHEAIGRVADTADHAHRNRLAAEVATGIAQARREADREQLALLHDTAAATLLLVAHEALVPSERLAAQASRDLALLIARPLPDPSAPVDVIALLREETAWLGLPVLLTGLDHLWLDGELGRALSSASREALNNVDRHACARSVTIYAGGRRLEITDDGCGFVTGPTRGHGIRESIVARMCRAGGSARIRSVPGQGTTVELRWHDDPAVAEPVDSSDDTEQLVRRVTSSYSLALMSSGLVLLTVGVVRGLSSGHPAGIQFGLAAAAALCTLAAAPRMLREGRWSMWVAAATLAGIAIAQHELLDDTEIRTYADWSLGAVGFCLLPFLVRLPAAYSRTILSALWTILALVDLARDPSLDTVAYIGVAAAAFFVPQVAACSFSRLVTDALRQARRENRTRLRVETRDAVAEAMQSDCIRRYSDTVDRLVPLLRALSAGCSITGELRHQARTECRRLRTLFDQSEPESTVLAERIHSLIGKAEDRGVDVTAHVGADLPDLPEAAAEHVLGHVDRALEQAQSWARIILTAAQAEVDLSVVCDVGGTSGDELRRSNSGSEVVVADDTMWMTIRAG
jgi:hypothetical protein